MSTTPEVQEISNTNYPITIDYDESDETCENPIKTMTMQSRVLNMKISSKARKVEMIFLLDANYHAILSILLIG